MEAAQNHDKVVEVVVGDVSGQRVEFHLVLRDSSVPQRLRYLLQWKGAEKSSWKQEHHGSHD